ncbi:MAG: hypothetical protein Q9160_005793 [Pyrenula sp. 1 TL-2023]
MAEAPPKKSRFNRPAWSKAPAQAKDNDREFFRHSNNGYANIIAEKVKRREERQREAKRQEEEEKERQRQSNKRGSKRRRLSIENEDGEERNEDDINVKREDKERKENSRSMPPESPSSKRQDRSRHPEAQTAVVIDLEDEDGDQDHRDALPLPSSIDEDITILPGREPSKPKSKGPYSDDESDEDDDYMRDIKRRAREKERQKRLGLNMKPPNTPENLPDSTRSPSFHDSRSPPTVSDVSQPNSFSHNSAEASQPQASDHFQDRPEDDPIIDILIQSPLPDTKPLLVRRRASQPLAEVRLAWCQRQLFDKPTTAKVFFTWRGNRVFDVTTCRNFLIRAEKDKDKGNDVFETDWESKASAEGGPRIEVIATTQELFDQERKRQETRKAAAAAAAANGDDGSGTTVIDADADAGPDGAIAAPPEPPRAPKLRITLKSPNLPDLPLKVGPDHTIGKIVRAFRQQQGLSSGANADGDGDRKTVYVLFDGERLEEEMRVGDTEIEDLDSVDVIVR